MIIAVDFDGTLCTNLFPKIGRPIDDVIKYIKDRQSKGDKIILWTCREEDRLGEAVGWCEDQGIIFDAVNDNLKESIEKYGNNSRKVDADLYIDDKGKNITDIQSRRAVNPYRKL
jgi:hypothetical protein